MSIHETAVIDAIGVHDASREAVLTLIDPLPWEGDATPHLLALQDKLNHYLHFIESGQLLERYPQAEGRRVAIDVVFRHSPDDAGRSFLAKAAQLVAGAGFELRSRVFGH